MYLLAANISGLRVIMYFVYASIWRELAISFCTSMQHVCKHPTHALYACDCMNYMAHANITIYRFILNFAMYMSYMPVYIIILVHRSNCKAIPDYCNNNSIKVVVQ